MCSLVCRARLSLRVNTLSQFAHSWRTGCSLRKVSGNLIFGDEVESDEVCAETGGWMSFTGVLDAGDAGIRCDFDAIIGEMTEIDIKSLYLLSGSSTDDVEFSWLLIETLSFEWQMDDCCCHSIERFRLSMENRELRFCK